eukprot:EG_transcript_53979
MPADQHGTRGCVWPFPTASQNDVRTCQDQTVQDDEDLHKLFSSFLLQKYTPTSLHAHLNFTHFEQFRFCRGFPWTVQPSHHPKKLRPFQCWSRREQVGAIWKAGGL